MTITYTITTPETHTKHSTYAAWYTHGTGAPGVYTATVDRSSGIPRQECQPGDAAYDVSVTIQGTIIEDYWGSHFGGMPISTYDRKQNAGNPFEYTRQYSASEVARSIAHDDDSPWVASPEWQIICGCGGRDEVKPHRLVRGS